MIIETIFNVIVFLLLGVISLFPKIPTVNFDFLNGVVRVVSLVDMFVSLRVVSVCFVFLLILHNAHLIWAVIMWVVKKIPGVD